MLEGNSLDMFNVFWAVKVKSAHSPIVISDCVQFVTRISLFCQVCEIIESPLFLKLNPMTKHTDVSSSDSLIFLISRIQH